MRRVTATGVVGSLRVACGASLVFLCVALSANPAQASASGGGAALQGFFEYTVSFAGKGSYNRSLTNSESQAALREEASWTWNSVYPHVLIPTTSSIQLASFGFPAIGLGQEGSGKWTITNTGSVNEDCSNSGTLGLKRDALGGGGGSIKVHRVAGGHSRGVVFNLIALEGYETTSGAGNNVLPCDPEDWWAGIIEGFASPGLKHTSSTLPDVRPLSTTVTLTPSDLKHGTVTKNVSIGPAEMVSSDCGSGGGITCQQAYTWSGAVRFTKHKFKKA